SGDGSAAGGAGEFAATVAATACFGERSDAWTSANMKASEKLSTPPTMIPNEVARHIPISNAQRPYQPPGYL
ncbi:MAG TPA: hypothetical protein VIO86_07790, partial [Candidatus Dormibacteraeota bacterium]